MSTSYYKTGLGTGTDHVIKHQNKMFQSDDSAIEIGKVKLLINVQNISFAYILNHFFI